MSNCQWKIIKSTYFYKTGPETVVDIGTELCQPLLHYQLLRKLQGKMVRKALNSYLHEKTGTSYRKKINCYAIMLLIYI